MLAASRELQELVESIYTRTQKPEVLEVQQTDEARRRAAAQAAGGVCFELYRLKKWFRSLDQDSFSLFLTTVAQAAGLYACVMARRFGCASAAANGSKCATDAPGRSLAPRNAGVTAVRVCAAGVP